MMTSIMERFQNGYDTATASTATSTTTMYQ